MLLKRCWPFVVFVFLFSMGLSHTALSQEKPNDVTIRITAKELQTMPTELFLNGRTKYIIKSCVVSLEDENKQVEYKVQKNLIPLELKARLGQANPGELIIVENRVAVVDGKDKKLPDIIYSIVEK